MGKRFLWVTSALLTLSFAIISWKTVRNLETPAKQPFAVQEASISPSAQLFNNYVNNIYHSAKLSDSGLDSTVFEKAVTGFFNLKVANKLAPYTSVVTIVDLAQSSCSKRMWIVDLDKMKLLLNTWVSHGQGSGGDVATNFSNEVDSYQSSLGFYVTNNVYQGKHGLSVRLDGMDEGFNDMAAKRDIVVHAAPYVSQSSINMLGRLGRSQGCPAVSPKVLSQVIGYIKGKTLLFINGNDNTYNSKYLDQDTAANFVLSQNNNGSGQTTAML